MSAKRFSVVLFALLSLAPQQRLADRVVAVVDDEPIMLSEVRQSLPPELLAGANLPQLMRTNLEALINQTLIMQEVRRLRIFTVRSEEVDEAMAEFTGRFPTQEVFEEELRRRGLTEEGLRSMLRRRMLVLRFVNYRFRRYTEIEEGRLREFYEGEWTSSWLEENPGSVPPPFEAVRGRLEILLGERIISDEVDRWLEQARADARIAILL